MTPLIFALIIPHISFPIQFPFFIVQILSRESHTLAISHLKVNVGFFLVFSNN